MTISRTQLILAVAVTLLLSVAATWVLRPILAPALSTDGENSDHATQYTCPMHPAIVSDTPGTCPICHMDLIPKKSGGSDLDDDTLAAVEHVALSPIERVLANVHTTVARAADDAPQDADPDQQTNEVRAPGVMVPDPDSLAEVPSWLDGRIETLHVKKVGTVITRNQAIMEIYSPDLYAAQQEYLFAYTNASEEEKQSSTSMVSRTQERLQLLGMDKRQIQRIQKDGRPSRTVTVRAPNAGTITKVLVRQGQYVQTGSPLFEVEDQRNLRIEAAVRTRDLAFVKTGNKARIVHPETNASRQGTVEFVYPTLDVATRTVTVRIALDSAENWLPKDAYVTAYIERSAPASGASTSADAHTDADNNEHHDDHAHHGASANTPVIIPRSAVIQGGIFNRVYVETEENVFEARNVEIQVADKKHLLVTRGLSPGDIVVTSGAFLLDSEAQLHAFGSSPKSHDAHGAHGDHAEHGPAIPRESIPSGGKAFEPSIHISQAPDDVWLCNMGDLVHWIQKDKKDATCPLCKMDLIHHDTSDDAHGAAVPSDTIPTASHAFDPSIHISQAPDDVWLCNMSDLVHWIQKDKKDAKCPLCKMDLIHHQKGAKTHDAHDAHGHHDHAEDHP